MIMLKVKIYIRDKTNPSHFMTLNIINGDIKYSIDRLES